MAVGGLVAVRGVGEAGSGSSMLQPPAAGSARCEDLHELCRFWAAPGAVTTLGECATNRTWMLAQCPRACDACPPPASRWEEMQVGGVSSSQLCSTLEHS